MLRYEGARHFRQRIILATLSGKAVRIDNIRADDAEQPGLRDFEVSLLRLLESVVNGCEIVINAAGTGVRFRPGAIIGGVVTHDCPPSRGVGYFVEALLMLAPFAKMPLVATLRGVTNDEHTTGVDAIRTVTLPLMRKFGLDEGLDLKIVKRGALPNGGGEVELRCPVVRKLGSIDLIDEGKVKRVRGVAFATRVAPHVANRMVETARGVLNDFLPDVWLYTDHYKGERGGASPGFGLTVVAESTTGSMICVELNGGAQMLPEDVGQSAARLLCEEIANGGYVDTAHQPLALLLMALGPEDVSRIRIGKVSQYTIEWLRLLRDFLGVTMHLKPDPSTMSVVVTCRGVGYSNIARRAI
ncbi:RNA 3'-terminal phosphate cyclase/enolpyruvate transferase [Pavlovales sp. CCMP2436]|nr:RNA 3'-terminal phosphate cyclase/enolpyruvate transferase [Pavlovales sp. CCMP2436]